MKRNEQVQCFMELDKRKRFSVTYPKANQDKKCEIDVRMANWN